MARQGKGILGGFSGSIANITGNIRKEGDVIKKKITTPNPSKSETQSLTRSSMKYINFVFKLLTPIWYTGKDYSVKKNQSLLNAFTSQNLRSLFLEPSFPNLSFFKGGLVKFNITGVYYQWSPSAFIQFQFPMNMLPGYGPTEHCTNPLLVYFKPLDKFYTFQNTGINAQGGISFDLIPDFHQGGLLVVYFFRYISSNPSAFSEYCTATFNLPPKP